MSKTRKTRMAVPPPPASGARPPMPPAPDFGWIGNPDLLTLQEWAEMHWAAGKKIGEMGPMGMMGYAAVALARRVDPELYPWTIAPWIPMAEIRTGQIEADPDDEQVAQQVADAIEAGEPMPDPA